MSRLFFITGLPRSRTAWFSAFMSASGFPCLHEGMNNCLTNNEYREKVEHVSDSNTGFIFIDNPYPERPLLIIHRKGRFENARDQESKLYNMSGMHVNFDDINQRMPEIFKYLTGEFINNDLYQTFKDLNITTMVEMNTDAAKAIMNETN